MSMMVNIMIFIITFNLGVAGVGVIGIFERDDGSTMNYSLPQSNEAAIANNLLAMNASDSSSSSFFGQNILSGALQQLSGISQTIKGIGESLKLIMTGVVAPGQILMNMCEEIANDAARTGVCADGNNPSGKDGIGTIIKWFNYMVYTMYFIFIVQFIANRSYEGMK